MNGNTLVLVLSLVAGVVGTGIGGIIGVLLKGKGNKIMGRVLSFAGGVMVGIATFEMLPEAVSKSQVVGFKPSGVLITVAALIIGMLVIYGLNKAIDVVENMRTTHIQLAELHHETKILEAKEGNECLSQKENKRSLLKAGIIMLIAIALHNFPEGMAIGATGAAETSMGVVLAIIIAVHNIPEGMAISAPLASGGVGPWKTIGLTTLAGAATVLGAVIGLAVGGIGAMATGICLALAAGAMLYVTFCEILPQATLMEEGRVPAVSMLIGIVSSMLFVYLF
ncbi:MAG: ZIP family metal transporter [Clostridia bacterium]